MISVEDADRMAVRAHGDDRNKSGMLFIEHVRRVAARMEADPDPIAVPAALLHDTVEKSTMDWSELRAAGADGRLIAVVDALTERDGEPEREYLARCAAIPLALRIKRADIQDKLDAASSPTLTDDDRAKLHARAERRLGLLEDLAGSIADSRRPDQ